jgi:undecaprenyl-diphosphatase
MNFDRFLFLTFNSLAGQWPWLDALARLFLNDYFGPTLLAVILIGLWFEGQSEAAQRNNQRAVLVATLGTIVANSLLKIINLLYYRPRPFAQHEVTLLFYRPTDSSFPSNAAAIGFAIAAGVWLHNRAWGRWVMLIALLFGVSRIFGGVHFPLDVLAGAGLGWVSAWWVYRQEWLVEGLLVKILRVAKRLEAS